MNVNWKIRFQNKAFWIALIPAVALVMVAVADVFGISFDPTAEVGKLTAVVEAVFALLAVLGIVVDPTTKGVGDSDRALEKTELD